ERWWGALPDLLAWSLTCRRNARQQVFSERARSILEGSAEDAALGRLERRNEAAAQQRVVFVAASRRGRGWNPAVALQGRDELAKALREGKGAILWSDPFAHAAIIGKCALAGAGIRPWHLSYKGHGILDSPLAELFLNHRMVEVEMRYLAGRIVFDPRSAAAAVREMMRVLAGNGVVSLTNNAFFGQTVET